jgi:hypothetical protein
MVPRFLHCLELVPRSKALLLRPFPCPGSASVARSMLAAGHRAAGPVLKSQVQVERNPSIYKICLLAQPVCSFGVDLAALSSNPLQRLIKTTPFLSLLFRSHTNWAAAHQNFSSVARVRQLVSVASGPDQFQPAQFLFSLCFLKFLQICKSCLIYIFQTITRNKKYFI